MIQRTFVFVFSLFFILYFVSFVQAIPPTDLKLDYDQSTRILHIQMTHISTNVHKHHIRRIEVFKNDKSVKVVRLVTQNTGHDLSEDVSVEAKKGDVLRVKAICNQAGTAEVSIIVTEDKNAQERSSVKDKVSKVQKTPAVEPKPPMQEKKTGY